MTEIIERLAPADGIELVHVTAEDEYFPPPPELRDLLRVVETAAALALGAPQNTGLGAAGGSGSGSPGSGGSGDGGGGTRGGASGSGGAGSGGSGPAGRDDRAVSAADVLRPPRAARARLDRSA